MKLVKQAILLCSLGCFLSGCKVNNKKVEKLYIEQIKEIATRSYRNLDIEYEFIKFDNKFIETNNDKYFYETYYLISWTTTHPDDYGVKGLHFIGCYSVSEARVTTISAI